MGIAQPDSRPIADGHYMLYEAYTYHYELNGVKYKIEIPEGFVYDGTSIPRFLWSVTGISRDGLERAASLIHDTVYVCKGFMNNTVELGHTHYFQDKSKTWQPVKNSLWSRKQADKLFARILGEAGVKRSRRRAMYKAVRYFGWIPWRKKMKLTLILL